MQTPDCDDREVSKRLRQLRALVDSLRSRRLRAEAGAPSASAIEAAKAAALTRRLSAALDAALGRQAAAAAAHAAALERDERAAAKLRECISGLAAARVFPSGYGAPKPYARHSQTVPLA